MPCARTWRAPHPRRRADLARFRRHRRVGAAAGRLAVPDVAVDGEIPVRRPDVADVTADSLQLISRALGDPGRAPAAA
ncbi:MAG TPA: hypothetical protein VK817_15825 [Trebonia sp.]|nr:hypothetical protein [Trebonia sp.]